MDLANCFEQLETPGRVVLEKRQFSVDAQLIGF